MNQWSHVALTFDVTTRMANIYYNGGNVASATAGNTIIPQTAVPFYVGYRSDTSAEIGRGIRHIGGLDEVAIFNRALDAWEISEIYAAGAAGKCGMPFPPAVCGPFGGAQISVPGQVTNSFLGSTNWQPGGLVFQATGSNTVLNLGPVNSNLASGVLVDSFVLTESAGNLFVLPEESLRVLEGQNAYGLWQLEIIDTRTGASNNVALHDWQLRFIFQDDTSQPKLLTPGDVDTSTICELETRYYIVDVPPWATYATNRLLTATGPLNVYFNQYIRPTGTNVAPPDYTLLALQTSGIVTLSTNLPPPAGYPVLLPGQRYYLAVQNPSTNSCVTFSFLVDFDIRTFPDYTELTNGTPYCTVNLGPVGAIDYYRFTVSSNAVRAQFELSNLTDDLTLLLRRGLPPSFASFDYLSANVYTNDEVITVFDFSQPVPLQPGDWYFGAANVAGGPVGYCATAYEWPVYGTNIVITNVFLDTNSFCLTWTSLPGVNYYVEGLTNLTSTNWFTVSPTIKATDYASTFCLALPSPFQFFRVREGTVINPYFPPPYISIIRKTFDGIELIWGGPITAQYQVQWTDSILAPITWNTFPIPPAVTSTTGIFAFLDDGTQTGGFGPVRYYRILLLP